MAVRTPIHIATGARLAARVLLLPGCVVDAPEAPEPPIGDEPVAEPLEVSVASLAFGTVNHPEAAERAVSITNRSVRTLEVAGSLADLSEEFELVDWPAGEIELPAGGSAELTVRFAPTTSATHSGRLMLATTDDEIGVELPLAALGRAPRLSVEVVGGGELGPIDWRCPATAQVQLRSTGTLPVELQSVALGAESSTWSLPEGIDDGLPRLLAPGELETLAVTWTPSGETTDSVEVVVGSDDPVEPSTAVEITGVATPAPVSTVSTVVEPRADLILAQSDTVGVYCGGGPITPGDPVFQIPALLDLLVQDEVDFRAVGCDGDTEVGGPFDPGSDPDDPPPVVLTAAEVDDWNGYVLVPNGFNSGSQALLSSITELVTSPGYATTFRRPGARLLIAMFREWGLSQDPPGTAATTAATLDAGVLAPELWSPHLSAAGVGPPVPPDEQELADFVTPKSGLIDEMCDGDFEWFIEGLAEIAATPTRYVEVGELDGDVVEVRLQGVPVTGWTWHSSLGLVELSAEPARGETLAVDYEPPPVCGP